MMEDVVLSAEVEAALIDLGHAIDVSTDNGVVFLKAEALLSGKEILIHDIERIARDLPDIQDMRKEVVSLSPSRSYGFYTVKDSSMFSKGILFNEKY